MLQRFRQRFGTASLIVAIIALVAALGGTALAAKGALSGKQKKEVEKIAKKFAGKPGAPGADGAAGPAGAKGDTGAAGTNGTNGTDGAPGTPGTNGKSVVLTSEAKGANCAEGGTKVEVEGNTASKKYVCNGTTGFTDTLPSGKTETGTFVARGEGEIPVSISFPIQLATEGPEESVFYLSRQEIQEEEGAGFEAGCTGTWAVPTAPKGILCVYAEVSEKGFILATFNEGISNYGKPGTILLFGGTGTSQGSWAVTSP